MPKNRGGLQLATVYKPIRVLAEARGTGVKMAKELRLNMNIRFLTEKEVPFIRYEPVLVTKDNMMDTVIKDGFHTMEEIYRNVPRDQWPSAD